MNSIVDKPTICVDIDGVLAYYTPEPDIGPPVPGAVHFTSMLGLKYCVLIHTTRATPSLNPGMSKEHIRKRISDWLDHHGFNYDDIWMDEGKPDCVGFVDDNAVTCRPIQPEVFGQVIQGLGISADPN